MIYTKEELWKESVRVAGAELIGWDNTRAIVLRTPDDVAELFGFLKMFEEREIELYEKGDQIMIFEKDFKTEKEAIKFWESVLQEDGYANYYFDDEYNVWVVEVW